MITYKSKIITYLAWLLIGYLIFQKYTEYKNKPKIPVNNEMSKLKSDNSKTMYTIKIDEHKNYEQFTLMEKFAYKLIKNYIPEPLRKKIESSKKNN